MKLKTINIILLVSLIFIPFLKAQAATNYFVSTTGSDSNPGTESQPWRNLEKAFANSSLNPGDVINVRGGVYRVDPSAPESSNNCMMLPVRSGTSGNPITIKAYNNEDVLMDGRWDIKVNGGVWQTDSHPGWWSLSWKWNDANLLQTARRGQLWDNGKLIPSTKTGNFNPPNNGSWWMLDVNAHKIYYHPASSTDPNNLPIYYSACGYQVQFNSGIGYWVVDGIDEIAAAVIGYTLHSGSHHITIQNLKASYNGDNSCKPGRDGTNGHSITGGGGPGVIIRNNDFSQDVAELIHTDESATGGQIIENNIFHDASRDPGWGSQCANQYGPEYDDRRPAPGIIVRSSNVSVINNQFYRNNYEAIRIESDYTAGPASPKNVIVSGNYIKDNIGAGIACSGEISSDNVDIFNNYLSGNNTVFTWQGQINLTGNCTNYKIHDNTIVNTLTTPIKLNGNTANVYNNCTSGCPDFPLPSGGPPPPPSGLKGDLNKDGIVNSLDWSIMNSKWFTNDSVTDLNHDGIVNSLDFSIMNGNWLKTG